MYDETQRKRAKLKEEAKTKSKFFTQRAKKLPQTEKKQVPEASVRASSHLEVILANEDDDYTIEKAQAPVPRIARSMTRIGTQKMYNSKQSKGQDPTRSISNESIEIDHDKP